MSRVHRRLERLTGEVGAGEVPRLRAGVERLEDGLAEHRDLQRLLADEVSRLERAVRSVSRDDGGAAR